MKTLEQKVFPYLMLLPMIVIFSVFLFYPAARGLYLSFTKWDGINKPLFVGVNNYIDLFKDKDFLDAFLRTMWFTLLSVPGIFVVALGLAMLLTSRVKGKGVFRAIFYWPCLISSIVVGLSWRFLLGEDFGVINYFLTKWGHEPVKWLTNAGAAFGVIVFVTIWSMAGYYMVMFIAGLQAIPSDYYEAAQIDGARFWQRFHYITMPLLRPTSLLVLVLSVVAVIKTYPLVIAITDGGPASATKFMVQIIQETGFQKYEMGYASAMTMILFILLAILTAAQFGINKRGGNANED